MAQDGSESPKKTMVPASSKSNVATPGSMDRKGIKLLKVRDLGYTRPITSKRWLFNAFQCFSMLFNAFH